MEMIEIVDKCYLFDNSSEKFKLIAKIMKNQLLIEVEQSELPKWFNEYVLKFYLPFDIEEDELIDNSRIKNKSIESENKNKPNKDHFLEINYEELEEAHSLLRSINHKIRLKILHFIYIEESVTIIDIYFNLKIEHSIASQHLAMLRREGIIVSFKEGNYTYYKINLEKIKLVAQAIKLINDA
jgi:ArsR family transcriptional regulator, virulence genes transcriptional regulator